jgi:hypothetical protein
VADASGIETSHVDEVALLSPHRSTQRPQLLSALMRLQSDDVKVRSPTEPFEYFARHIPNRAVIGDCQIFDAHAERL